MIKKLWMLIITLIKNLEKYVGTISENNESEDNSKPSVDPIWDEARRIIA